jgi:hypothetical protein
VRSPIRFIAFTLLAPVTVPAYIGFLAFANLLGGAFYIVIEATLSPMLGRPVSLSRTQMVLLTVPVLAAAPFAMTAHLVVWLVLLAGRFIVCTGRWQTALQSRMATFLTGVAWITVAVWTTVTCLNAAVGTAWIGMPIQGRDVFVEFSQRPRTLGQLPPEMQRRRRAILEQVQAQREAVHPRWEVIRDVLQDDDFGFRWMRSDPLRRKLTGMPWYFDPAELSRDGQDHSIMLMGPLLFVWLVLVRWPGTFWLFRWPPVRVAWLLARLGLVGWSVFYLITWEPITDYYGFIFEDGAPTPAFKLLSPALLLGMDYEFWVRPEWYLFNAGLWIAAVLFLALLWHIGWAAAPFLGWPRYYVAFLAARLLQRKRIAFFSVGAVTLCVAMMIIVNSVMGGFVDSIRARANGLLGDLILDGGLQGFPFYQEFINQVSALKDKEGEPIIEQATPLIHSYGILQCASGASDSTSTRGSTISRPTCSISSTTAQRRSTASNSPTTHSTPPASPGCRKTWSATAKSIAMAFRSRSRPNLTRDITGPSAISIPAPASSRAQGTSRNIRAPNTRASSSGGRFCFNAVPRATFAAARTIRAENCAC